MQLTHVIRRKVGGVGGKSQGLMVLAREGPAAGRDTEPVTIGLSAWGATVSLSVASNAPEDLVSAEVSGSGDGGGRFATSAKSMFEHDMLTILGLMVVFFAGGSSYW